MRKLLEFVLISSVLLAVFGCAAETSEKAAADAAVRATTTAASTVKEATLRFVIPSGTVLTVALIDPLNTDTNSAGDGFLSSLAESVVVDGTTVLQKGRKVRGRVVAVEDSSRVRGLASIRLALTEIMQGDRTVAITTDTFAATADSSNKRDGEIVAGDAGIGAPIGAIAGGGRGAAVGAITGGGAGTGVVLATEGKRFIMVRRPVEFHPHQRTDTVGKVEQIDAKYELLQRGQYTVNVLPADLKPIQLDKNTPLDLYQARNAVRIARWAGAENRLRKVSKRLASCSNKPSLIRSERPEINLFQ